MHWGRPKPCPNRKSVSHARTDRRRQILRPHPGACTLEPRYPIPQDHGADRTERLRQIHPDRADERPDPAGSGLCPVRLDRRHRRQLSPDPPANGLCDPGRRSLSPSRRRRQCHPHGAPYRLAQGQGRGQARRTRGPHALSQGRACPLSGPAFRRPVPAGQPHAGIDAGSRNPSPRRTSRRP